MAHHIVVEPEARQGPVTVPTCLRATCGSSDKSFGTPPKSQQDSAGTDGRALPCLPRVSADLDVTKTTHGGATARLIGGLPTTA
ncbi:hypothetical protein CBOM_03600 [Ceraceosorus bombacis]|uniref:Uncharacterized protein n=1 Tax=Ceraceosorus bombacis TaxID=401625 RepID=A0A0P1BH62_9BASI|nr:hypothetical protein CBOM_03600 [Ceraceosorus bombacis]